MRPRILMVNESSVLNTGYSVYGREVLSRLHNSGKYDVAELATYIRPDDQRLSDIPWKVYTNLPEDKDREEYSRNIINQFGAWKFESVCLDFKPHIVFNIQDPWMFSYIQNSPYRNLFNFVIMPTVDSAPQSEQWLELFSQADGVFTYTEWSKKVLDAQTNFKIKTTGIATPSVANDFFPLSTKDRANLKDKMGFNGKKIIGTVMRNQKRKLFPVLFQAFSNYIEQNDDKDTILYCHTSFPDMGWDIPRLLLENGITSRVYFTYKCKHCGNIYPSLFKDAIDYCPKCGNKSSVLCSVQNGADNKIFNFIYNLFDIYAQVATCLVPGQKIKTESGWINIEDVAVGQRVLTHTGKMQNVIEKFKTPINNLIFEISVNGDNKKLELTGNHPLLVVDKEKVLLNKKNTSLREVLGVRIKNNSDYDIPTRFVNTADLSVGDLLVEKIDRNYVDVDYIDLVDVLLENNTKNRMKYDENNLYIYYHDTDRLQIDKPKHIYNRFIEVNEDFCKFLGLYVADGTSSGNSGISVCCSNKDLANIKLAQRVMNNVFGKKSSIYHYKDREAVDVNSHSAIHKLWFRKMGKLENKQLPEFATRLPIHKQKNIVCGMFMGDGCYYEPKNISIYNTTSEKLAQQLKDMLINIGVTFNLNKRNRPGKRLPLYTFEVRGNIKNMEFDFTRSSTKSLNNQDYYIRSIKSIKTKEYSGFVYNLEVENDNSYTTELSVAHNCEGLGIPAVEAAACGVPIMAVDYSAMTSVLDLTDGYRIKCGLQLEMESGAFKAIPDEKSILDIWSQFFSLSPEQQEGKRKQTRLNFLNNLNAHEDGWMHTTNQWVKHFDSVDINKYEQLWQSKPDIRTPSTNIPKNINNAGYVRWLITDVLCDPSKLNTYFESRMIRDLNYGCITGTIGNDYYTENSLVSIDSNKIEFNREIAYSHMCFLREKINKWEFLRGKK
jgi:intein/homing endonuclease/DNA-directed RNA polymerase subunit RPC12/RpoP